MSGKIKKSLVVKSASGQGKKLTKYLCIPVEYFLKSQKNCEVKNPKKDNVQILFQIGFHPICGIV